jgi:Fic family protein
MIHATPELGPAELAAIEKIDELKTNLQHRVAEPRRWVGGLRRLTFARAVQGSNSIEGYDAGLDDVLAVVEDEPPFDAASETVLALQGYRDALTYVLQLSEEDDPAVIDESLLKSLHYMMIKYDLSKRPGRWRKGVIFVRRESDNEIVYEGPDRDLVPDLMAELLDSLRVQGQSPLVRAAMAHLNLVMIHPFADGNGRMARCLQTLVLTQEHVRAPVFCSIEEYLGRNTDAYYAVLQEVAGGSWHPRKDAMPWIHFCLTAHHQQAETLLLRVSESEELWGRCETLAFSLGLPERAVGPMWDASRGIRIRNALYRRSVQESDGTEIEIQTASRDLKVLVDSGVLDPMGETRGRYYVASERLRDEWRAVRENRRRQPTVDLFGPQAEQLGLDLEG